MENREQQVCVPEYGVQSCSEFRRKRSREALK